MEPWQFKFPTWDKYKDKVWDCWGRNDLRAKDGVGVIAMQPCRWVGNIPVIKVQPEMVEHTGVLVHSEVVKPTNPKDVYGSSKISYSVIPANVLGEVGLALTEGALKYGRHNYRDAGVRYSVYYDAALRHLTAWWEGEDLDPEAATPISHITKAIAGLIVLRDSMLRGNATDDRPPKSAAGWIAELNTSAAELLKTTKPKHSPKHHFEKE